MEDILEVYCLPYDIFTEPLGSWRHLEVTGHRTTLDWAKQIKWLLDDSYQAAQPIPPDSNLKNH
jgi:hypothetical protein